MASKNSQSTFLWVMDKTQETVIGIAAAGILYTWSPGLIYFTVGAVLTTRAAKLLKLVLRQPRPERPGAKVTYGMPSTHSAAMAYICTSITLASLYLPPQPPFLFINPIIPPLVMIPWSTTVILSRIWLGHHTLPQVCAGAAVGVGSAFLAFNLWVQGLDHSFTQLVQDTLSRIPFL